jgi:hypothetical protein
MSSIIIIYQIVYIAKKQTYCNTIAHHCLLREYNLTQGFSKSQESSETLRIVKTRIKEDDHYFSLLLEFDHPLPPSPPPPHAS